MNIPREDPVRVVRQQNGSLAAGWVVGLLFLVAMVFRFVSLDADPPCTVGLHFISDEGWWVHNARNKALFDTWILDEFNQSLLVSPTFCLGTYAIYSLAGVSIATSRILPVLSGLMCILLFSGLVQRHTNRRTAITVMLLFGCNFGFTQLNRTAYVDSTALMFLLLAWWLIESLPDRVWAVFLAGMSFALAVVTKSYVLSVIPPLGIVLCLRFVDFRHRVRFRDFFLNIILFCGGLFAVYMLWRKYIYLPNLAEYRIMYHLWQDGNFPSSVNEILRNIPSFFVKRVGQHVIPARFFMLNATLVILAAIRLIQYVAVNTDSLREKWRQIPRIEKEALIFLVVLSAEIAPLTAKPFRRYIFLYLPLVILAASTLRSVSITGSRSVGAGTLRKTTAILTGAFLLLLPPFIERLLPVTLPLIHSWIIAGIITLVAGIPAAWFLCKRILSRNHLPLIAMVTMFLIIDGGLHLHSALTRSFTLRETSRKLAQQYFKPDTVVLGGIAHTLCLETSARPIAIWGRQEAPRVLNQDPVRRFHPDYLIILTSLDGMPWVPEARYDRYVRTENFLETLELLPCRSNFRVTADLYRAPVLEPDTSNAEKLMVNLPRVIPVR